MCGDDYTVADLVIYNELATVLALHRRSIESRDMANVFSWYKKISNIPEVIEVERKFRDVLENYSFN